jgi:beta-carotene 3-hydroxylase
MHSPFVLLWVLVASLVFALMELWAALLHGRIWHGLLWRIHRSHHRGQQGGWETNDGLSLLHAPIAIALILYGCRADAGVVREIAFASGVGMSLFGVAYLVVHDGLVHGRLPVASLLRFRYFASVKAAHLRHHQGRHDGPPFGLFLGPLEVALHEAKRARQSNRAQPPTCSDSGLPRDVG